LLSWFFFVVLSLNVYGSAQWRRRSMKPALTRGIPISF
jgi:hypothetical protein